MKAYTKGSRGEDKKPSGKGYIVTPEMLKNGDVLCGLVVRFIKDRNKENMFALLSCLRDSNLFVPAVVNTDAMSTDTNGAADNPVMFPAKGTITVTPQYYKAKDGNIYMPVYSRMENARQENLKGASLVNMPYANVLEMLESSEGCTRLVLDPHLYNVVLDEDLIRISKKLPSRLKRE